MKRTFIFIISSCLLFLGLFSNAQKNSVTADTLVYKQRYGLRLGGDMSKLIRSFIDDNYSGFEINGDYRLTNRLYLAGEIGTEERTLSDNALNVTAKGTYFKAGVDYNLYSNWLDMENMIFAGFRIGASTFNQTLNSYDIYNVNNQYWDEQVAVNEGSTTEGLSALWGEIILGIKAEVMTNLYMGLNLQLKGMISDDPPTGYENLYVPGFNRTYDSSIIGAGFGYTISYLIPIYKKNKIVVEEQPEDN